MPPLCLCCIGGLSRPNGAPDPSTQPLGPGGVDWCLERQVSGQSFIFSVTIWILYILFVFFFYMSLTIVLSWCSSPEWDEIDPSEREDLHLKMEDGEFWWAVGWNTVFCKLKYGVWKKKNHVRRLKWTGVYCSDCFKGRLWLCLWRRFIHLFKSRSLLVCRCVLGHLTLKLLPMGLGSTFNGSSRHWCVNVCVNGWMKGNCKVLWDNGAL